MGSKYFPLVTIVIPVFNGASYVSQAIESALNQTYDNLEIIVVNDGSPDNSEEVIAPYMNRVRYFKKSNGGVSTALNYALKQMKGIWFSWLSHDDLYLPDKITSQIKTLNELLDSDPDCDIEKHVLICQDQRIDEKGNILPRRGSTHPEYNNQYELVAKEVIDYSIGGCTVLASKRAYEDMGGFDETNRTISDADMWFRLILNGYTFDFDDTVLVQSRYHKDMVSIQRSDLVSKEKQLFYSNTIKTILPFIDENMKHGIVLSMTKSGMDSAAKIALGECKRTGLSLYCSILYARIYRKCKAVLRCVYRKIRWK